MRCTGFRNDDAQYFETAMHGKREYELHDARMMGDARGTQRGQVRQLGAGITAFQLPPRWMNGTGGGSMSDSAGGCVRFPA